jgi:hypothetical protein
LQWQEGSLPHLRPGGGGSCLVRQRERLWTQCCISAEVCSAIHFIARRAGQLAYCIIYICNSRTSSIPASAQYAFGDRDPELQCCMPRCVDADSLVVTSPIYRQQRRRASTATTPVVRVSPCSEAAGYRHNTMRTSHKHNIAGRKNSKKAL